MIIEKSLKIKFIQKCKCGAVTIRFTGETSKMSWAALPVEPACMGKVGEGTRRPLQAIIKIAKKGLVNIANTNQSIIFLPLLAAI